MPKHRPSPVVAARLLSHLLTSALPISVTSRASLRPPFNTHILLLAGHTTSATLVLRVAITDPELPEPIDIPGVVSSALDASLNNIPISWSTAAWHSAPKPPVSSLRKMERPAPPLFLSRYTHTLPATVLLIRTLSVDRSARKLHPHHDFNYVPSTAMF